MKYLLSIFLLVIMSFAQAQTLESVQLKASDLVSGNAENDLIALAESAKIARKPVVVMAPDSWRQQIAGMLRRAWPQIELKLKKSPSGKMKAYLYQPETKQNAKTLAPEVKLDKNEPKTNFAPKPETSTEIESVKAISQSALLTPGLAPLGKPVPATRPEVQPSSVSKLRTSARAANSGIAEKHETAQAEPDTRKKKDAPVKRQTRSRNFANQTRDESSPQAKTSSPDQAAQPSAPAQSVKTLSTDTAQDMVQNERKKLEEIYNNGKTVNKTISVDKLRLNDVLYVWEHNILVARKSSSIRRHFWLLDRENLNLDQPAIRNEGNHLYRIKGSMQR